MVKSKSKIIFIYILILTQIPYVIGSGVGVAPTANFNPVVDDKSMRNEILFEKSGELFIGKLVNSNINLMTVAGNLDEVFMVVREQFNHTSGGTIYICVPNDNINEINRISLYFKWSSLYYPVNVIWDSQKGYSIPIKVYPIKVSHFSGVETYLYSITLPGPGLIHIKFDKGDLPSKSVDNDPLATISFPNNNFFWTLLPPFLLLALFFVVSRKSFAKNGVK